MKQKSLVLCDSEADYAQQMAGFLERDHDFPWDIIVCTGSDELEQIIKCRNVEIVVMAESLIKETLPKYSVKYLVLLNESGCIRFKEVLNIDKYQAADHVRKALLQLFADQKQYIYPVLDKCRPAVCVAFYSPVRRCLQTSTAITFSQILSEKYRVLYLNFENFAHFLYEDEDGMDMTALLYYADVSEEEMALHVRAARKSIGDWDYIVPMRNGENLSEITFGEWQKLIKKCKVMEEYDFIVLDLNDTVQGIFELLLQCERIYTIEKSDGIAQRKIIVYEHLLKKKKYENILQKTRKLQIPAVDRLPECLEDYSRGILADYVRKEMIMEEEDGVYRVETEFAE